MSDRDAVLQRIARAYAPPWWRPVERWRWRRFSRVVFSSPRSLAHWSQLDTGAEAMAAIAQEVAGAVCEQMSEQLPDGYSFKWD